MVDQLGIPAIRIRCTYINEIYFYILTPEAFKTILPQFSSHPLLKFGVSLKSELGIFGQQLLITLYTRFSFNFLATGSKYDGETSHSNTS